MNRAAVDPGSFRDPGGQVYLVGGDVYRTVNPPALEDYRFVQDSGLIKALEDKRWLVSSTEVAEHPLGDLAGNASLVLHHPRLPFISYPYEWCFPSLKAAALLHLDIQLEALEYGVTLSDASAYNIQFMGAQPVFIDRLSFVRYNDGELWQGHRQFCEQFLNPLLLRSLFGIAHNAWYRGAQEGVTTRDLRRLLKFRHHFSWNILTHVVLQDMLQAKPLVQDMNKRELGSASFPRASFKNLLQKLRRWVAQLQPADTGKTLWQEYADNHSYADDEAARKHAFVEAFTASVKPDVLWDFGCNSGDYSLAALSAGAGYAVGFDFDQGALEAGTQRAAQSEIPFQCLFLDAANPAGCQGWDQQERKGLKQRAPVDGLLALAFIHHMVIAKNIPLDRFLDWLVGMAPAGVVEFVPKQDAMVQRLLSLREDIFPDYTEENFLRLLAQRATVVRSEQVSESGRLLVWYQAGD